MAMDSGLWGQGSTTAAQQQLPPDDKIKGHVDVSFLPPLFFNQGMHTRDISDPQSNYRRLTFLVCSFPYCFYEHAALNPHTVASRWASL